MMELTGECFAAFSCQKLFAFSCKALVLGQVHGMGAQIASVFLANELRGDGKKSKQKLERCHE